MAAVTGSDHGTAGPKMCASGYSVLIVADVILLHTCSNTLGIEVGLLPLRHGFHLSQFILMVSSNAIILCSTCTLTRRIGKGMSLRDLLFRQ
jgi:hypothetical protein